MQSEKKNPVSVQEEKIKSPHESVHKDEPGQNGPKEEGEKNMQERQRMCKKTCHIHTF